MRNHTIGLLIGSPLISAGIASILRTRSVEALSIYNKSSDGDPESWLEKLSPSLVIIDPLAYPMEDGVRFRSMALVTAIMPPSVTGKFDDMISIYDSEADILKKINSLLTAGETDPRGMDISPREKEVIMGIVKGLSNKEIASEMNVSVNTIMTHRRNIASKLQIHSPAGLTIFALAKGIVKLEEVRNALEL